MPQDSSRPNTIPVRNPRSGEIDYQVTPPTREQIVQECKELRSAQAEWSTAPLADRIGVMLKWADAVDARRDQITKAESEDTGRWRLSSESPDAVIWGIRGWCGKAEEVIEKATRVGDSSTMPDVKLHQQLVPYPLLGVISPWNFPLMLSSIDAIPALIAGCAAIIKPSEVTPRFIEPDK